MFRLVLALGLVLLCGSAAARAQGPAPTFPAAFDVPCEEGTAAGFPCDRVDLLAYLPFDLLGGGPEHASDLWGFAEEGRELVLLGRGNGTVVVDVTLPTAPVYLGRLGKPDFRSPWRDIKVYQRHAFVVSEALSHGMQVFDLGKFLEPAALPIVAEPVAVYREEGLSGSHNIAINEATGVAYIVGSSTCGGGLHMVDVRDPRSPHFLGCFASDGYTHDVQCVSYEGPDPDFRDREICFASNEDSLTIVDVTDKAAPRMVSRTGYSGSGYTHQSWTTEDRMYLLMGDELDEQYFGHDTMTRIWDVVDLEHPLVIGTYLADTAAIDHNLYIRGDVVYEANYRAGLRVLRLDRVAEGALSPAGFFDIYPADDAPEFNGAWSVYPFFPSGTVAVSGIEQGLFLLRPRLP